MSQEARKTCWTVVLYWKSFAMVSTEPLTHDQALECVRSIWPNAMGVE